MKVIISTLVFWVLAAANLFSQVDTTVGNHLYFNGSTSFVDTKDTSLYSVFTVECWVKSPSAPGSSQGKGPVHYEKNFQINWDHVQSSARNSLVLNTINGGWKAATFGPLLGNTWYDLVGTYDGDTLKTYTNGRLVTQKVINGGSPVKEEFSLKIGKHAKLSGAQEFFQGSVDEVRVWNIERTADEIRKSMHHPLTGNEPGLKHYYQFNQNQIQNDSVQNLVGLRKVPMVNAPQVQASDFPFGKGISQVFFVDATLNPTFNDNSIGLADLQLDSVNRPFPLLLTRLNTTFQGPLPDTGLYKTQMSPYWIFQGLDTGLRFKTPIVRLDQNTIPDFAMLSLISRPRDLILLNRSHTAFESWGFADTCHAVAFGSGHFIFKNIPEGQFCLAIPKLLTYADRVESRQNQTMAAWLSEEGFLNLKILPRQRLSEVALFDIHGSRLVNWINAESQNEGWVQLPIQKPISPGMYFFRAIGNGEVFSGKVRSW